MQKIERLIIVGGNAAGMTAALRARRLSPELDITVIEQSDFISGANCSIPAYLEGKISDISALIQLKPERVESEYHINLLTRHRALSIAPREHQLQVQNLSTEQSFSVPYHRLILATGASPICPNWVNRVTKGLFFLRSLQDAVELRQYLEIRRPESLAIIGTGTIAQACVSVLRTLGINVFLVGKSQGLLEDLEEPISERIRDVLKNNDVSVYLTDNLRGLKVSLDYKVEGVELADRALPCQGVLMAMGISPNTQLAKTADLAVGIDGTIRVDRHLMTSRQYIYACGDCTHTSHRILHKPVYWPLATTANRQGRLAGENTAGGNNLDLGSFTTRLWTCFNLQIGRVGISSRQAQVLGIRHKITAVRAQSKSRFYGGDDLDIVMISDDKDGRILGAQLAGFEGVHARLNTMVAAIAGHLRISELEQLDFGFTPKLANVWDPVQIAGRIAERD
ncbi:MAG: FAD-dependent oxidoreductase [bacterium]